MKDPLLGEKLRTLLAAVRTDLKPLLPPGNARLRCELVEDLLARLSVEVDDTGEIPSGIAAEAEWRAVHENRIAAILNAPVTPAGSSAELEIPVERFNAWFADKDPTLKVTKVTTVPGGRSKGTIMLEADDGRKLVVRRDFSAAVTGTSVADEFPVIKAVHEKGLRVPEPKWLEDEPDAIGGRFIVFERLAGSAMGTLFHTDATPAFCRDFAAELARLHSLDPDALGLGDVLLYGREPHPVRAHVASYESRYRRCGKPIPLIDAAFAWLHEQLPLIGNERRIVHGDAALHNTMGEGDILTGLLDWEFCHAGDPAEDLAYCRFLVARVMPWEEFIDAYRSAGGPPVSEVRMTFFTVWRTLLLSVLTGFARAGYESGTDRDLRVAAIGYNTLPKQLRDLAADLYKEMSS